MSTLYNLEPQPTAKVVLHTTTGSILLELFAKQTPLASRNFLQHCLDGYYTNTLFHRLIPGFIIQGGDPTGTGSGGISAINNGAPFEDEFHTRLKFNRRGLLGMANEGKDSNGSQFFLTLGATPELQGKHTMFGRVEGETIYNLMKMGEAELAEGEGSERPLYPVKITGAEVLVNPFEDMVARVKEAPRVREENEGRGGGVKKRRKPAGKNVLSFGGEEGEEEAAMPVVKKVKANPKLISAGFEEPEQLTNTAMPTAAGAQKVVKRQRETGTADDHELEAQAAQAIPKPLPVRKPTDDTEDDGEDEPVSKPSRSDLDKTNAEIAALKASMKRTVSTAPSQKDKPKNALEAMIPVSSTRGRKRGKATDEKGALDLFKSFKQRLEDLPTPTSDPPARANGHAPTTAEPATDAKGEDEEEDEEATLCDLHFIANCQSCKSWDSGENAADGTVDGDAYDDPGWLAHQLSFAKDTLGKDLEWKRKMAEINEYIE